MTRHLSSIAITVAALAVTACSDSATSPVRESSQQVSPFAAAFDNGASNYGLIAGGQPTQADFTLTAGGGTVTLFGYTITFPPNSVCDPSTSTYGPTEWDAPCSTLRGRPLTVHAVMSTVGGVGVDFTPPLRFSPNAVVTLSTNKFAPYLIGNSAYFLAHPALLNFLSIYYAPSINSSYLSDFGGDPSVITHVNFASGTVWRRIKHFSGYFMSSGEACTPSPDVPDCVWVDNSIVNP